MRVKVTWKGDGQPDSGVYEYGYGTDHPKIPQGITRQKDDPDSNWTFEYVGQETSSLKMHSYLNHPVWFYTSGETEYYAADRKLIPEDASNVKQGKYVDVYRIAAQETRDPASKSPLSALDKSAYAREKKLFDQLARMTLSLKGDARGDKNVITLVPDGGGEYSLLSLYLFAVKTGNDSLVSMLNSWVGKKNAMRLTTTDLFSGDRAISELVRETPAMPIASAILGSRDWESLNSNIAKIYSSIQNKIDGLDEDASLPQTPAPQSAPTRAIPEVLAEPEIIPPTPRPPPTPSTLMESKVEFIPSKFTDIGVESTDFSKKYSSEEVNAGLQYLKNVPDMVLSEVFSQLSASAKQSLTMYLAGFVKKTPTGFMMVPSAGRHFRPTQPLTKSALSNELLPALGEFEAALNKRDVEFELSNAPTQYSPIVAMDFPYMWAMGRDSEKVFAAIQGAFMVSLTNRMREYDLKTGTGKHAEILEDMEDAPFYTIQLTQVVGSVVMEAISDIWSYKSYMEADREMLSPLGQALIDIAEKSGVSQDEVQRRLDSVLKRNIDNLANMRSKTSSSYGVIGGKGMPAAGRPLALAVSAHTGGLKSRLLGDKENTLMHVSQGQLGTVLQEILGERVEVALGDSVTYYPSAPGKESVTFSLGLLQYQHNYMPYFLNKDGEVIIEVAGDEHNLSRLEGAERGKVLDAFMDRVASLCNSNKHGSIEAQDAVYHSIQKYQHGLYTEYAEEASAVLGGRKPIEKIPKVQDVHNDTAYLQQAVEVISSLTNFIATDLEQWLKGGTPQNLSSEEISSLGGEQHRLVELAFQRKIEEISLELPAVLDGLEIPGNLRADVSDMIMDALGASRESARKKMESRGLKGKSTIDTTQIGSIMEHTQVLVPALSAIRNAVKTGKTVEVVSGSTGRGMYHTGLTPETISGKPPIGAPSGRTQSYFLRQRFTSGGFHIKIGGKDNFFVKEDRTGGFGDIIHLEDPRGEAAFYPFEGKTGKGSKILKPHLSQISPMMRFILASTSSSKSIKVGKTGTIHLQYGDSQSAQTPLGQSGGKANAMYFIPKFGVAKIGNGTVDYDKMIGLFSSSDGAGLDCINYS